MLSEVRSSPRGPHLDLSSLFPEGVFAFLTLRGFNGTDPEDLQGFLNEMGFSVRTVHRVEQVHSGIVVESAMSPCAADALVGSVREEAARVVTADCVPILLASADGSRYAAVHAGWKGTLARIVQGAVRAMDARPSGMTAYIGPAVGPCCYSVDEERHALFASEFPGWLSPSCTSLSLDLQSINARQLAQAGIPLTAIHTEARCTACEVGLCCSYRRDGERAGRMAALIGRSA
jgi:YfiH family protein